MKSWILRVLGVLSVFFGLAFFAAAVGEFRFNEPQNPILGIVLSVMFVVTGLLIFKAIRINYQFNLSILVGACLVFFGLSIVTMEVESLITGNTEGLIFVLIAAVIFLILGVLLIRFGNQKRLNAVTG